MPSPTALDLFCGCGGFSLGLVRAGFQVLAAVDFNKEAVETLRTNLKPDDVRHVLERDLTTYEPAELAGLIGSKQVDLIVGGPPCQGFSTARQRDGANNGSRIKQDPRRQLYKEFLRFIDFFQPKVFVMENVLGIRTADGGAYLGAVQHEARKLGKKDGRPGYRVMGTIEEAEVFGVPQKRRRQLFIGIRQDLPGYLPELTCPKRATSYPPLGVLIGDLPLLQAGEGQNEQPYDLKRRTRHIETQKEAKNYLENVLEVGKAQMLTNHVARPHSQRDLDDFALLAEGESSAQAMRRGVKFQFPYDKTIFKDRYTKQSRFRPCSTIVAHLSKDGLMFIHPGPYENRSLTPREAARIQSFPDWFRFPEARTHSFRLIGNAVPPLVSEAVGNAVRAYLQNQNLEPKKRKTPISKFIPVSESDAVNRILPLLELNKKSLQAVPREGFMKCWAAIAFLYQGLHPDSIEEHGTNILFDNPDYPTVSQIEPRLVNPYYEMSGWPVVLEKIADEALSRYQNETLNEDEFYCLEAQLAGMEYRLNQGEHESSMSAIASAK